MISRGYANKIKFLLSYNKSILKQPIIDWLATFSIRCGQLSCFQALIGVKKLPQCPPPPSFLHNEIWEGSALFFRRCFPVQFPALLCGAYSKTLFLILAAKFNGSFREGTFFIKIGDKEGALRFRQQLDLVRQTNHYYLEFDSSMNIDATWKQFVYFPNGKLGDADMNLSHNLYLHSSFPDIMIAKSEEMQSLLLDFADIMPASHQESASVARKRQYSWKDTQDDTRFLGDMLLEDKEWYENAWENIRKLTGSSDPSFEIFLNRVFIQ